MTLATSTVCRKQQREKEKKTACTCESALGDQTRRAVMYKRLVTEKMAAVQNCFHVFWTILYNYLPSEYYYYYFFFLHTFWCCFVFCVSFQQYNFYTIRTMKLYNVTNLLAQLTFMLLFQQTLSDALGLPAIYLMLMFTVNPVAEFDNKLGLKLQLANIIHSFQM